MVANKFSILYNRIIKQHNEILIKGGIQLNVVNILLIILMFSLLIFVHELGHFVLAKINKVDVEQFSFGFGSRLCGIKHNGTDYNIKILPFGGSVQMSEDINNENSLPRKKPIQRLLIVAAGPLMSYLFGIFLFSIISFNFGFSKTSINSVQENMPAYSAGLKSGDKIVSVNNKKVFTTDDIIMNISANKSSQINIGYVRNDKKYSTIVTPVLKDKQYLIGIAFNTNINPSVLTSIKHSFNKSISSIVETYHTLGRLLTGKGNVKTDIGGPVTIVRVSNEVVKSGIWNLIYFTGFITIQLAIMNLLPFPALDGGWILMILFELISRKKLPEKAVELINTIGFMILMAFMVFVMIKDILFPIKL